VRVVVLPLSKEPLWESTGLFLGTLAFPGDEHKASQFALAWCRDGALRAAKADPDYANGQETLRWFMVRDAEAEKLFEQAEKALLARKTAYVATQAEFIGALNGWEITHIGGFGERTANTREDAYVKTNVWLGKPAGTTTKSLIRDAITPSRPVIHAAFALYHSVAAIINETNKGTWTDTDDDTRRALKILLGDPDIFSTLLDCVERCRLAAPPTLNVKPEDLIQFVAG
jgi:hypothetical protein